MPKKEAAKLWTVRMPAHLLDMLRAKAASYELPTQTFMKLIVEMGLDYESREGLMIDEGTEEGRAILAYRRRVEFANRKARGEIIEGNPERRRHRRVRAKEEGAPEPVEPESTAIPTVASPVVERVAEVKPTEIPTVETHHVNGAEPVKDDLDLEELLGTLS